MTQENTIEGLELKIRSTLTEIEKTIKLIKSFDLNIEFEVKASNALKDLSEKRLLLSEALTLCDKISFDEMSLSCSELIEESNSLCRIFE